MLTPPKSNYMTDNRHIMNRIERHQPNQQRVSSPTINHHYLSKDYRADSNDHDKPNDDTTYPITCGNNQGELIWKKFVCPGINAKCVKTQDTWLTPKEFVNLAGKSTLKDWKRAIRIKGQMLRKLIEQGDLNYYDHDNNCSNQCRSNKSFDEPAVQPHTETSVITQHTHDDSGSMYTSVIASRRTGPHHLTKRDLQKFWSSMINSDLFEQIMGDALNQFKNLMGRCSKGPNISAEDAVTLTNTVAALEIIPNIRHRLNFHKHSVDKQSEDNANIIHDLEKRLAEQKKLDQDLKRKSRVLTDATQLIPTEKRPKMYKIVRQKAIDRLPNPTIDVGKAWSDFTGSSTTPPIASNLVAATRGLQHQRWPDIQQQMNRMNLSDPATFAGLNPAAMLYNIQAADVYPQSVQHAHALFSSVAQAAVQGKAPTLGQQGKQMSREGTPQGSSANNN